MKPFFFLIFSVFALGLGTIAAFAQNPNDFHSMGNGIDIDSRGVVLPLSKEKSEMLGNMTAEILEAPSDELNKKVPLRKISLKKLDAHVKKIVDQYEIIPDAIRYLGGLTSIDLIVAVPEENDLLLIGPAEGWKTDAAGNIIGKDSGKPILVLEDFLTIFRAWNRSGNPQGITCAIEPTQEAQTKLVRVHQQFTNLNAQNADAYVAALEEAYGSCPITITGIPATSRFARVLIGADFKMKRIALGLEPSQTRNVPSYVRLLSTSRLNISPQFWLTPEYSAVTHDSKKLTWRLNDFRVRVSSQAAGGLDRAALNWCRSFEDHYETLAKTQPVFGELRNNMKLTLAAALIQQEQLLQKANCTLTILMDENNLKLIDYPQPKSVTYQSVKSRSGFSTVVACGGVRINPAEALKSNMRLDHNIDSERGKLIQMTGDLWWSP